MIEESRTEDLMVFDKEQLLIDEKVQGFHFDVNDPLLQHQVEKLKEKSGKLGIDLK